MATNLVLIFIDVSCTKTLTCELILVKKHYQREDRVLLDLALVLASIHQSSDLPEGYTTTGTGSTKPCPEVPRPVPWTYPIAAISLEPMPRVLDSQPPKADVHRLPSAADDMAKSTGAKSSSSSSKFSLPSSDNGRTWSRLRLAILLVWMNLTWT